MSDATNWEVWSGRRSGQEVTTPTSSASEGDLPYSRPADAPPARAGFPTPLHKRIDRSGVILLVALAFVLGLIVLRVGQLQMAPELALVPHIQDRVTRKMHPAPRGDLQDRRGRTLAATRPGFRAFVDPVEFTEPYGPALAKLSDVLGKDQSKLAEDILGRKSKNDQREADGQKPYRYVRISDVLDDGQVEELKDAKIKGLHLERRSVREEPGGGVVASILGKVDVDHKGMFGAEKNFDQLMMPRSGHVDFTQDASGKPLWVEANGYSVARPGNEVKLSIDLTLQEIVYDELVRGAEDSDAAGARCVMLDPSTGEVLAMVDYVRDVPDAIKYTKEAGKAAGDHVHHIRWRIIKDDAGRKVHPALGRNRCVEDVYEPGSTFKCFMWSSVTERRLAEPDEVFQTFNGKWTTDYGRKVEDVHPQSELSWSNVLVYSSNIGMVQGTARMTFEQMHDDAVRFGFGTKTGIGLPGESSGIVTPLKRFSKYTQTSMASGYEVAVTPLQMVRAFSVFARNGELSGTLPSLRLTAVDPLRPEPDVRTRVLPKWVADLTREVMGKVADNMEARYVQGAKGEPPFRYKMFGKSGTANVPMPGGGGYFKDQYNSSFIAGAPLDNPRIVCLVVIDDPGPKIIAAKRHYGSASAGPVLARIMRRSLEYYGVPPSEPLEQVAEGDEEESGHRRGM